MPPPGPSEGDVWCRLTLQLGLSDRRYSCGATARLDASARRSHTAPDHLRSSTMAFKIEESFHVDAPVERVWRYLIDPRQVVECLPGAELTEAQDDRIFLGKVKVKVGPVVAGYNGKAQLTEVNEQEHRVRIVAEGRESAGSGSAKMTMTSLVAASPAGGCDVRVEAELDVAGE